MDIQIRRWVRFMVAAAVLTVGVGVTAPVWATATDGQTHTAQSTHKAHHSSSHQPHRKKAHRHAAPTATAVSYSDPVPTQASFGQKLGLHATHDPLALKASAAIVVDQDTDEVLFSKNPQAVLPIASITKLMTAVVVTEAKQPLDDVLTITDEDIDTEKGSHSRLSVGTHLTRAEMLHLALMSSENRAAHALGRNYPGGLAACVAAMNQKAQQLGMAGTHYVDPTGLSSSNQSTAHDLALLVKAAYGFDMIRSLSTDHEHYVAIGHRELQFHNSNSLISSPQWTIGLQKTGYITEAGRCMVMQAELAGRKLILVLLDSATRYSRVADAERLRHWLMIDAKPASFSRPST